jgi:hypothetical protein
VLQGCDTDAPLGEFTRLGLATVLPSLTLCVVTLWIGLRVLPRKREPPAGIPAGGWRVLLRFFLSGRSGRVVQATGW